MMEGVTDVSTGEAAALLGLSVRTLQHWAKHKMIEPAGKTPGGRYRWDIDDLRRQLRENLGQAPAGPGENQGTEPERPGEAS
jgi:phage terminase Nu1 subunit (DNA packaging protein)